MVEKITFEVHQWTFVFVTVASLSQFCYCHISLLISDNLGQNLISRDIIGKKRTRAFICHQAWCDFNLHCWRYGLFKKCARFFDQPCMNRNIRNFNIILFPTAHIFKIIYLYLLGRYSFAFEEGGKRLNDNLTNEVLQLQLIKEIKNSCWL